MVLLAWVSKDIQNLNYISLKEKFITKQTYNIIANNLVVIYHSEWLAKYSLEIYTKNKSQNIRVDQIFMLKFPLWKSR